MWVYCLVLVTVFFLSVCVKNYNNRIVPITRSIKDSHIVFWIILIFVVLSGFRYHVGADYNNYVRYYDNIKAISSEEFWMSLLRFDEPGFKLLCILCRCIYDSPITFFVLSSVIIIVPCVLAIKKRCDTFCLGMILFVLLVFVDTFGAIRQYMAAAIILTSLGYIEEKKFWKFVMIVFIAASFHMTALIMIPLYFLLTQKVSFKNMIFIILGSIVLRYSYDTIFSIIGAYKDDEIVMYSYMTSSVNIFRVLVAFAPIVLVLLMPKGKKSPRENTAINIVLINAALMYATMDSAYLARANIYMVAFFPIVIPEIMKRYSKKMYFIIGLIMVTCYFFYWIYGIKVQNLFYESIFMQ